MSHVEEPGSSTVPTVHPPRAASPRTALVLLRCREPLVAACICIGLSVIWSAEGSRQGLRGAGMSSPRDNDHELPVKRARLCENDKGRTTARNAGCRELQGGQGCFLASGDAVNRYESWLRETGAWWDQENVEIRSPWRDYSAAHNVPEYLRDGWGLMSRGKKIKKGTCSGLGRCSRKSGNLRQTNAKSRKTSRVSRKFEKALAWSSIRDPRNQEIKKSKKKQ